MYFPHAISLSLCFHPRLYCTHVFFLPPTPDLSATLRVATQFQIPTGSSSAQTANKKASAWNSRRTPESQHSCVWRAFQQCLVPPWRPVPHCSAAYLIIGNVTLTLGANAARAAKQQLKLLLSFLGVECQQKQLPLWWQLIKKAQN